MRKSSPHPRVRAVAQSFGRPTGAVATFLCAALLASSVAAQDPALEATDRPRLLVLEVTGGGVEDSERRTLTTLIGVEVAALVDYDVVTTQELEKLLTVEKDRQLLGCLDASCLAEVADAMGTERIVFGEIGKIGSTLILTLSLFDSIAARATERVVVKASKLDEFVDKLPGAVKQLTASLTGASPAVVATADGTAATSEGPSGENVVVPNESSATNTEEGEAPRGDGVTGPKNDGGGMDFLAISGWSMVGLGGLVAALGAGFDLFSPTSDDRLLDLSDAIGPAMVLGGVVIAGGGAAMALVPGMLEGGDDNGQ